MPRRKPDIDIAAENEVLRQHQRVLAHLALDAADPGPLDLFLDDVARRLSAALEIDHVKILRYRAEEDDLFIEAGVGWKPAVVKAASLETDLAGPAGRAFQTGQPVVIDNLAEAPEFRVSDVLREHGIVSLMNVPVFIDHAVWGVLEVDSSVRRGFSDESVTFMQGAAALISLVIRRTEAESAQARAVAAAAEEALKREVLLREMQHRVKNYFQTILAMIALRKPRFTTEHSRGLADQIEQGIMAMALAHAQLEPGRAGEMVGLAGYIRALVRNLEQPLDNVRFTMQLQDLEVTVEQAVPIGLILNEVATNAVKHAFGADGGSIAIELRVGEKGGLAELAISDNGKGLPANVERGSGIKLMRSLADQLRGSIDYPPAPRGTTVRLCFYPKSLEPRDK